MGNVSFNCKHYLDSHIVSSVSDDLACLSSTLPFGGQRRVILIASCLASCPRSETCTLVSWWGSPPTSTLRYESTISLPSRPSRPRRRYEANGSAINEHTSDFLL